MAKISIVALPNSVHVTAWCIGYDQYGKYQCMQLKECNFSNNDTYFWPLTQEIFLTSVNVSQN
jgi:hypothetical protein